MILYPNFATLVNFEIPKVLAKISGTFLRDDMKEFFILKLLNKISGKTNVPTPSAYLEDILQHVSKR